MSAWDTEHIPFGLGLDVWLCAAVTHHTNSIKGIKAMICAFWMLYRAKLLLWDATFSLHPLSTPNVYVILISSMPRSQHNCWWSLFMDLLCGCGINCEKLLHWLVVGFPRLLSYWRWHFIGLLIQSPPINILTTEYNTFLWQIDLKVPRPIKVQVKKMCAAARNGKGNGNGLGK